MRLIVKYEGGQDPQKDLQAEELVGAAPRVTSVSVPTGTRDMVFRLKPLEQIVTDLQAAGFTAEFDTDVEDTLPTAYEQVVDAVAAFDAREGHRPKLIQLPVLMAYDVLKAGLARASAADASLYTRGVVRLEEQGLLGARVEIVRRRDATLQLS